MTNTHTFIQTHSEPTCSVCGSQERIKIAEGQDFEYETCQNIWQMWECQQCSHIQLDPRPADSTLSQIYPKTYYSYNFEKNVNRFALACKAYLDKGKFNRILSHCRLMPKSYLDIGCGDGRYLAQMIKRGLSPNLVHGLELDENAVKRAQSVGLQVQQCRIEDAQHLPDNGLDMATMFHVIEHVANPALVISQLAKKMTNGATLVIETPNADSFDAKLFKTRYWGGYHFPRHWHIFTPQSLSRILEQNGFRVKRIEYQPGHAFWLFSIHHWLKYEKNLPQLAKLFNPLRSIPALAAAVAFDKLRSKLGFKTSAMLFIATKI